MSWRGQKAVQQRTKCIGLVAPVFDERDIGRGLGSSSDQEAIIPLDNSSAYSIA